MERALTWLARGSGIGYAAFLSLLALDVFSEGYGVGETVAALFIHLIPASGVVLCLAAAWRWERMGGWLFVGLGLVYGVIITRADATGLLVTTAPLVLIGALFLWAGSGRTRRGAGPGRHATRTRHAVRRQP